MNGVIPNQTGAAYSVTDPAQAPRAVQSTLTPWFDAVTQRHDYTYGLSMEGLRPSVPPDE